MAANTIQMKTTNPFIYQGTLDMVNNPIKFALLDSSYDPITVWAVAAFKDEGDVVQPTVSNGHYYRYSNADGTTGGTEPVWPTDGSSVDDNGMTATDIGIVLPIDGGKDSTFADVVSAEITGIGYVAGGVTLANKTLIARGDVASINGDDPEWPNSTMNCRWSVRYIGATVNSVAQPLISATLLDNTPADIVTTNSRLRLRLPNGVAHSLTVA